MKYPHPLSGGKNQKIGIFSLEGILALLMLGIALSWVVAVIYQADAVDLSQNYAMTANVHADTIITEIHKVAPENRSEKIRSGLWNYPNPPSISAAGMTPLPGESILTSLTDGQVPVVTVRWVDQSGEDKAVTRFLVGP